MSISRKARMADNWFDRILGGEIRPELDRLELIATQMEMPLRWLLDWCFDDQQDPQPTRILKALRREQSTAPDPFFPQIAPALARLVSRRQLSVELDHSTTPLHLVRIDDLRFSNRQRSKNEVEAELLRLTKVKTSGHTAIAEVCLCLAIWASIQRSLHRTSDACEGLCWALETARSFSLERSEAILMQWSACLLRDWGEPRQALRLLDRGLLKLTRLGLVDDLGKAFVDRGSLMLQIREYPEASADCQAGLMLLPEGEIRNRITAHQVLATCVARQGHLDRAIAETEKALELLSPDQQDLCRAHVVWLRGRFRAQAKSQEQAVEDFREALELLVDGGMPLDVALVALDLARSLLALGSFDELRGLAERVQTLATSLRAAPEIDHVLLEFVRTVRYGEITIRFLTECRKKLESAGPASRRRC